MARSTPTINYLIDPDYLQALLCCWGTHTARWRTSFHHLAGQASTSAPAVQDPAAADLGPRRAAGQEEGTTSFWDRCTSREPRRTSRCVARRRVRRRAHGRPAVAHGRPDRARPWSVRMAFDAPDLHQQRRTGAARATCARLGRGGRWFNGNEGCKYFSFNHFIPESIVPSSPSALLSGSVSTSIAAAQIQVQLASLALLRRAAPTPPHRTRIAALFRPCSACARRRGQQRASGKQRTLSTSSWPWFVHARAPPRRGREEPEAHNRAAGG